MTKLTYSNADHWHKLQELRSLQAKLIVRDIQLWLDQHEAFINMEDAREIAKLSGILLMQVRVRK